MPHRGLGSARPSGVVVAQNVQRAVHRQPHELFLHPSLFPLPTSPVLHPATSGGGANVHVPEEGTVGLWERERQYVGQTAPTGGAAIEAAHGIGVEQRELHTRAPPRDAFPGQEPPDRALKPWPQAATSP